jgi:hypothetical protein
MYEQLKDPFSRPSIHDLRYVLDGIEKNYETERRSAERLELTVPAELTSIRGNTISAMTREISRNGMGFLHKGSVNSGEYTVVMASDTREYNYRLEIIWCNPVENGMFISGGKFIAHINNKES